MYLGFVKHGIIILIIGIVLGITVSLFIPIPYIWIIIIAYWAWQIADAYKHYHKFKSGMAQAPEFKK